MCCSTLKIRANGVRFNQKTGVGAITIHGKLETEPGVDDPVIEIWNAVQHKMQDALLEEKGRKLINFTPLFPQYDAVKDVTVYQLMPTCPDGEASTKQFLTEAKLTLDIFYKNLFIGSFRQFLNDDNHICNYNGYSLYKECIGRIRGEKDPKKRAYDVETTRMLLEHFISFLGLPLPRSKEALERQATLATLEEIKKSNNLYAAKALHTMDSKNIVGLLFQEDFDELFAYSEEA
ncbi:hypothetical protein IJ103_03605 [Candidatus Saccharibacteria bacterium]|nr:hypothetical protein [Candidatus Saccharibacteria bacterium]MBQ9017296.1 hypothetical protein [Candidatus Saccharibacteria bacterium]